MYPLVSRLLSVYLSLSLDPWLILSIVTHPTTLLKTSFVVQNQVRCFVAPLFSTLACVLFPVGI